MKQKKNGDCAYSQGECYNQKCNIFKEIFKEEFQVAYQKVYEKLKNKK